MISKLEVGIMKLEVARKKFRDLPLPVWGRDRDGACI